MYVGLKVTQQVPLPASVEAFHEEQLKNVLPDGMNNRIPSKLRTAKNQRSVAKQIQIGATPTSAQSLTPVKIILRSFPTLLRSTKDIQCPS